MAASRTTSLRALRQLSKAHSALPSQQTRSLRITPHVDSSPFLTTAKPSFTKVQAAIEEASEAAAKAATATTAPGSSRQFNTSRSLKAVGDTSTIDFAFIPDFDPDLGAAAPAARVPLLPESLYPQSTKTGYTKEEEAIANYSMRHEISTASLHEVAPSSMREVSDNNAIDFHGVAESIKAKAAEVAEETGEIKRLFNGLMDDIFGAKKVA